MVIVSAFIPMATAILDLHHATELSHGGTEVVEAQSIRRPLLTAVAVLALASGCGLTRPQRAAVRSFSQATAALGEVTGREFIQMRDGTIEMNQRRLALSQAADRGDHRSDLEQQFTIEAVTTRVQATETIRTYGELLEALVEDTQDRELQTAADRFVTSVRGLPQGSRALRDEQLAAMGRLVQMVGGLIVEAKKREAIVRIVPEAVPQIDKLCDLLAADFDPDQPRLAAEYLRAADLLRTDAGTAILRARDPIGRAAAVGAYALAATSLARRDTLLKKASDAVVQLKTANRALARAIHSNEVTREDLESYVTTVRTLVETARVLH